MRLTVIIVLFCYLEYSDCCENKEPICQVQPNVSIAALILARGGSKGIPLKNLAKIGETSLLVRALEIIHRFGRFETIWVSTDDDRIANEVYSAFPGNQTLVHIRPPEVAQDHTTSIESTQEFLSKHREIENVALVQCTSPFLTVKYLEEAFPKFQQSSQVDCVFSVVRSFKLRWTFGTADGVSSSSKLIPLNFDPARRPRRQDWTGELVEAGMFYFARRTLLTDGRFQNENCAVVEIDARDALEIDRSEDLTLARMMVEARRKDG
ncbi:N-acylneuraminate cytidylyltransferase [Topomyia yanbarensis]|uniref:N-acylneuraminate cytidylyltransferase n=1 Tax=Topomyia yanbarensis TaxID=2498891 RepID=UPI00273BBC1C|nr:N-acylneuraminate cytidylyltransferase [Topomyia yanbarensis]